MSFFLIKTLNEDHAQAVHDRLKVLGFSFMPSAVNHDNGKVFIGRIYSHIPNNIVSGYPPEIEASCDGVDILTLDDLFDSKRMPTPNITIEGHDISVDRDGVSINGRVFDWESYDAMFAAVDLYRRNL